MNLDIWYTEKLENSGSGLSLKIKDVLFHGKSKYQKIDVLDTEDYGRVLYLDGLLMTTEKDEFIYHEMISHIPLFACKKPEEVLIIGGGDGGTVREVLKHKSVKKIILCEIDEEVINISKKYLPFVSSELDNPKVEIIIQDAVKYIAGKHNCFDAILIDSTDPLGPGEGLFTEEFYGNIKKALKPGGIMAAQTESPTANKREIKLIYTLLNKVFSTVKTYTAPIPTYPAGYWSWCFCSNNPDIKPECSDQKLQAEIEKQTHYYNSEIHKAAFVLPNFVKKLTGQK